MAGAVPWMDERPDPHAGASVASARAKASATDRRRSRTRPKSGLMGTRGDDGVRARSRTTAGEDAGRRGCRPGAGIGTQPWGACRLQAGRRR